MSSDREQLIKKTARAILMATQGDIDPEYAWYVQYEEVQAELIEQARAALAVFEEAHAPTDDEREALAKAIHDGPNAVMELAETGAAPHPFEQCEHKATYYGDADSVLAAGFHRTVQGEPSDDDIRVATLAAVKKGAKSDAEAVRNYREAERVIRAALPHLRRGATQGEPSDEQWVDDIETMAMAQQVAHARMIEIGEGVGGLGIRNQAMYEDMIAWDDASDNAHADTVLRLIAALRAARVVAEQGGENR